ncbi:ATP-binding cassette domain-containing protein [Haloechinothrix sp. YIM 98757]|uniref:ATP-binding cassette domain-containing protein n=1 Tax=Haloechinothrix aidingensis TaxID=2752311 RepID=A0A838A6V5_9PSEU|nr:ATP-binding cassette domain-containing protein [Haloechinothrix aidingensis]MBA0124878.1 ATP-binding cassette domain-containing protein [Haloechinothrix aidingensis]
MARDAEHDRQRDRRAEQATAREGSRPRVGDRDDDVVFELRDVSVRLGQVEALSGVDLVVRSGERVAIIGPSGAGKTTLISLLNGTTTATRGEVRALGCPYARASARNIRATQRRIGTIHQRFDVVAQLRTVHNVNAGRLGTWPFWKAALSLVLPRDVPRVREALAQVGIRDKLHERTGDLSGGEQQRVAIARVLVQQPDAILADEPVASLDPTRGLEIMKLLLDISAESETALLASLHDVDMALDKFERVVGLRDGRIVFDKRRENLHDDEVRALYTIDQAPGSP